MVKCERWYPTKAKAIAAFEPKCKRSGIAPPLDYPPTVSGDSITTNETSHTRARPARLALATVTAGVATVPRTKD